jgi:L-iditol 2-dehydrogenase
VLLWFCVSLVHYILLCCGVLWCRYANTYPLCLSLLSSKRVDVTPLITHRYAFDAEGVAQGFARASAPDAIKVMFSL